jgi:predicted nucleic acid-binding Zn finger protein
MTGPCSESSGGFLVLVGLCFLIQPLVADMVREVVKGKPDCAPVTKIEAAPMVGGYQRFDYETVEVCYE